MNWRDYCRPIIAEIIGVFSPGDDEAVIRKAISATYPFGERAYWPYKVWLSEVKRQLDARRGRIAARTTAPLDDLPLFGRGEGAARAAVLKRRSGPIDDVVKELGQ